MSYNYQTEKPKIFTEQGQKNFLKVRDHVHKMLKESGAFTMEKALVGISGDSWTQLAYVDRLVELGEIREINQEGYVPGRYRVFVSL